MARLLAASVLFGLLLAWGGALLAEGGSSAPSPTYVGLERCGVVDPTRLAPITSLEVDLDGDGRPERFVANWGGVERHRVQEGSSPPVTVRDATILSGTAAPQYSCVDLRAIDVDRDGDLDLVFASPSDLVVMTNSGGRLTVSRREPQSFAPTAVVRIVMRGREVAVRER